MKIKNELLLLILFVNTGFLLAADNWPDWRGPLNNGHSTATGLPTEWSESENVLWKTAIHDRGWSTPVYWRNNIWMTTASPTGEQTYAVCVDFETGKITKDIKIFDVAHPQKKHSVNSYATPSPVIEEGRLYVHFGTVGTACLDTKIGKILWTRTDLNCDHMQGPASSPFLFENLLIVHVEGVDVQYVIALNKSTGKTVWKSERPPELYQGRPVYRKAYVSPIVITVNGKKQLISNGSKLCMAFDPYTGKEIWRIVYGGDSTISRAIFGNGLLYINTGFNRPSAELWAVDPTGKGDVTETHVRWKIKENVPNLGSPIFVDGYIYMGDAPGNISCLDARTGEIVWKVKKKGEFGPSPVLSEDRLYFFNQSGDGYILQAKPVLKEIAHNILDDGMMASPIAKGNSLILRTKTHLYRITE